MAKKRNLAPESSQLGQPPLKQHQYYQAFERSSTSPFGHTNSVFGAAHSPSLFGASCSPAFGSSMPAFAYEQSSTSPFGHTNSVFRQNNSSNNPFSPEPFGTTTPFGSQTDSSIYRGTSTGVFDAARTASLIKSILAMPAYKYADYYIRKRLAEAVWKDPAFGKSLQLEAVGGFHTVPIMTWEQHDGIETSQALRSTGAIRIYYGQPSPPISITSRPTKTEEHGGTSGQTAKLESISAMPAYDIERFESCVAIAGADYCVIAMDFTGNHSKISQLSGKSVMASSCGFEADVNALQEVLSAENLIYERQHNKPMSCPEMHRLFYHFEKCHPNHDTIVLGGLDSEGNGCLFTHFGFDVFASRVGDSSQNSGSRLIVPPILKYKLPAWAVVARLTETEAVDLAKTVFASTTQTGDKLEIVVLNASGLRREYVDLKKDCDRCWEKLEVIVPTATGVRCDRCYEQVFSRERKRRSSSV